MNTLAELVGFALVVAAAATVGTGLALLVAGLILVAAANRPPRSPSPPKE